MNGNVHTVLYLCLAADDISDEDVLRILNSSRNNNAKKNITGVLFYKGNQFLQLLEGNKEDIEDLILTIDADKRQTGMVILEKRDNPRLFDDWSMDFANLNIMRREEYVLDLIQLPWTLDNLKKAPHRIRKMIINFKNKNTLECTN